MNQLKSVGVAQLTAEQIANLHRILALSARQLQYPDGYNFERPEDAEQEWDEYRRDINVLVRNVCKLAQVRCVLLTCALPSALSICLFFIPFASVFMCWPVFLFFVFYNNCCRCSSYVAFKTYFGQRYVC